MNFYTTIIITLTLPHLQTLVLPLLLYLLMYILTKFKIFNILVLKVLFIS